MIFKGLMQIPQINASKAEVAKLTNQIEYEQERQKEIEELKGKVNTDEYIEKMASEKLGLIKSNAKVFVDVSGETTINREEKQNNMVSVGSILEGKVVSVMPFGAFVDIGNKQSGLVHISELSSRYVKDINDCVKKGDNVKVKVIKIDESGKISLSMKQAEEKRKELQDTDKRTKVLYVLLI